MFRIPAPNVIESDEGYSVQVLGRTGLMYRELDWSMRIDSEMLAGPAGLLVYASSIARWESPHAEVGVTDAERRRIVERIRAAFRFRGLEIEIVGAASP